MLNQYLVKKYSMTLVQPTPIMTRDGLLDRITFTGFCVFFLDGAQKTAFGMPNT